MRKIISAVFGLLLLMSPAAWALETDVSYIYSSDHNQARAGVAVPVGLTMHFGLEAKYVEDKASAQAPLPDPVYSVYLPARLDLDMIQFTLTPFYYLKNNSHSGVFQDASAYGVSSQFVMKLQEDEVEQNYLHALVGLSYARQKGSSFDGTSWNNEDFDQLAFTFGVRQIFYDAFLFSANATAYEYPDGISRIQAFRGILDQKDLAFTQSFDVNRSLGKYTLSARMARLWQEQQSSLYVGYHYSEIYRDMAEHSVLVGNTFHITPQSYMDFAYNHLQNTHGGNKRDVFYARLQISF